MSDWISIDDSLPPKDFRVLGTDGKHHEIVFLDSKTKKWIGATSQYGYLHLLKLPLTHWMPLPNLEKTP